MNALPGKSAVPWSLRNRLLELAIVAIAGAWLTGGAAVYFAVDEESSELFDERVKEISRLVMSYADVEIDTRRREDRNLTHIGPATSLGSRYKYQIWSEKAELILRSANAPIEQMAPFEQEGFVTRVIDGEDMRTFVELSEDGDEIIMIAEPIRFRQTFIGTFHTHFFFLFVATLPLLLLATWWLFRRATRALGESARQILDRSPSDVRPIEVDSPPTELEPVIKSANQLLARFAQALDSERRLTAAAAHELRTPLAAVKMQAQIALHATSREELAGVLCDLGHCVDRASRMLEQLLTLARLETLSEHIPTEAMEVRLDAVAADVLHDLLPLLKKRQIRLLTELEPAPITGIEFGISVMLRNLIDNAARHSPPGSEVWVQTGEDATHCYAMVRDTGPGIPESERAHVFERFYRGRDVQAEGSGIGLSIVKTVLGAHHALIHLCDAETGGLCACVRFPKIATPTTTGGTFPIKSPEKLSSF